MWLNFIIIFSIIIICLFLLHLLNNHPFFNEENIEEAFSNHLDLDKLKSFNNRMKYDGIVLKPEGNSKWRRHPSNVDYYDGNTLYSPQGHTINVEEENNGMVGNNANAPVIDSDKNSQKSMFTLAFNKCSLACCPSTYSCDGGCVCTTEKQRQFIAQRGILG